MGGGGMVGLALGLETLLLAGMVLVLLGAASTRSLRRRRFAPRIATARVAVRDHLAGRESTEAQRAELQALPTAIRIRLLADLGAALSGEGRERLTTLAVDLGLLAWAERACASRRWWRRLRGVRLLTLVGGGERFIPALLADADREVRAAAATWSADHPDPQTIGRLLELLGDGEPLVCFMAKNALLRMGPASVGPLAAHLSQVRGRELEGALEVAIGLAEPRLAAPARALVSDDSARVRSLAATLTAAVGGAQAVATVEGLVDDPAPAVRSAAVEGLGHLGHWPAGPAIAHALRDPAWEVRRQAALALRALGAPGLVLLRRALMDEDRYARDMARQLLDLPDRPRKAPRRGTEMSA
jgi:HEAT repeat protein